MNACADPVDYGLGGWSPQKRIEANDAIERTWSILRVHEAQPALLKPGSTYSKRSSQLAKLRSAYAWATANKGDEISPPTALAIAAAEAFINSLNEDCLNSVLAISHDGDINFFFNSKAELFQVFIDDEGAISFYAKGEDAELSGDALDPSMFPYSALEGFLRQKRHLRGL